MNISAIDFLCLWRHYSAIFYSSFLSSAGASCVESYFFIFSIKSQFALFQPCYLDFIQQRHRKYETYMWHLIHGPSTCNMHCTARLIMQIYANLRQLNIIVVRCFCTWQCIIALQLGHDHNHTMWYEAEFCGSNAEGYDVTSSITAAPLHTP